MTIQTAIMALSPWVYWPLQETSGTVAADVSGHGINGTISGDLQLGVTGPEINTNGTRFYFSGQIQSPALGLSAWQAFTMLAWYTFPANNTPTNYVPFINIGDPANRMARGVIIQSVSPNMDQVNIRGGGAGNIVTQTTPRVSAYWHMVAFEIQPTPANILISLDGAAFTTTGGTPDTIWRTTDPLLLRSDSPAVLAHVALFTQQLTQVQLQGVANQVQAWPYIVPSNQIPAQPSTTVDLTPVLTDTHQILTNQSTAQPMIAQIPAINTTTQSTNTIVVNTQPTINSTHTDTQNIVNTLFPQLATFLNTIMDGITTHIGDGVSAITQTVGQVLSWISSSGLITGVVAGPTCEPIDWSPPPGLWLYGVILEITAWPTEWTFTSPDDDYSIRDLAVINITLGTEAIRRYGVHSKNFEIAPLPGIWYPPVALIATVPFVPPGYHIRVDFAGGVCGQLHTRTKP